MFVLLVSRREPRPLAFVKATHIPNVLRSLDSQLLVKRKVSLSEVYHLRANLISSRLTRRLPADSCMDRTALVHSAFFGFPYACHESTHQTIARRVCRLVNPRIKKHHDAWISALGNKRIPGCHVQTESKTFCEPQASEQNTTTN